MNARRPSRSYGPPVATALPCRPNMPVDGPSLDTVGGASSKTLLTPSTIAQSSRTVTHRRVVYCRELGEVLVHAEKRGPSELRGFRFGRAWSPPRHRPVCGRTKIRPRGSIRSVRAKTGRAADRPLPFVEKLGSRRPMVTYLNAESTDTLTPILYCRPSGPIGRTV